MSKFIVVGGAGFIGSHLVDYLIETGNEVIVIDNILTGLISNVNKKALLYNSSIKNFVETSIEYGLPEYFQNVEALFHFAAYPIRLDALHVSKWYFEETEGSLLYSLDLIIRNKIPRLVLPGSTTIYGQAEEVPTPETFIGPDPSFYGTAKFNSERWAEAYATMFNINVTICRFGRIQGERSRNGAIWELCLKLKKDPKHLQVLGDGTQTRSFVYVKDCIKGVITAYEKGNKDLGIVQRYNIANNNAMTIREVVQIILEESKMNPVISWGTESVGWKGDNELVFPDNSKLRSLGWGPTLGNHTTIRKTVQWTLRELGMV